MERGVIFHVECNRQHVNITQHDSRLCFRYVESVKGEVNCESSADESVPLQDIVAMTADEDANGNGAVLGDATSSALTLHIVKRSGRTLSLEQKYLRSADNTCKRLEKELKEYNPGTSRPKQLLVIINCRGGAKMGESIYYKEVAPLFKLCDVADDVRVTSTQEAARELLLTHTFDGIDGVVAVGGDGSFHECINAMLVRAQRDAGLNVNDPNVPIRAARLPIGLIPGGSRDTTVDFLNDTHDVTTAALHIVIGKTVKANVASLHDGGHLRCYSHLMVHVGVWGDLMKNSEENRSMGPERYRATFMETITKTRAISVEIEFYDDPGAKAEHSVKTGSEDNSKVAAKVFGIDTFIPTLVDAGEKVKPKFGDAALTVLIVNDCSISEYSQYIRKFKLWEAGYWDFNFIHTRRVQGYRARILRRSQTDPREEVYINCDGDPVKLMKSEFDVRLHREAVQLYGSTAYV